MASDGDGGLGNSSRTSFSAILRVVGCRQTLLQPTTTLYFIIIFCLIWAGLGFSGVMVGLMLLVVGFLGEESAVYTQKQMQESRWSDLSLLGDAYSYTIMDEGNIDHDQVKLDEVMLPDEELVGYYLTRKIQQRPLSIELIRQLDIYKYDPWDLPKLATTGEKEWYFFCPRDRKYRNSARPNRVTGAGFWKATGTDRPIYYGLNVDPPHYSQMICKCRQKAATLASF